MSRLFSPDIETFSTPPTTPGPASLQAIKPSLSRRNSRPSSIQTNQAEYAPNVVLEKTSPQVSRLQGDELELPSPTDQTSVTPRLTSDIPLPPTDPPKANHKPRQLLDSPCFVHSQLDKGASLSEWIQAKQHALTEKGDVGVAKSLQRGNGSAPELISQNSSPSSSEGVADVSDFGDDDYAEDYRASLTKQLAETAIGVREMSKQLGRARVRSNVQSVLIITKARDNRLIKLTRELALYLMLKPREGQKRGLIVYVDNQLRHSRRFDAEGIRHDHPELFAPMHKNRASSTTSLSSLTSSTSGSDETQMQDKGQLRYWTSRMCSDSPHLFDFVVTLGGDGTVLFTSWLFQRIVPPVLSFALGSLGFLTNFDFADHRKTMDAALDKGIRVNLRMRFTCTIYRAVSNTECKRTQAVRKGATGEIMMRNVEEGGWEALESGLPGAGGHSIVDANGKTVKDRQIKCFTTRPVETFEVLNDLVVDRGPSPYVSLLELFGDEHHMTTVQADGLTVSTPTGSTAYSLSAGGSLVHPEIPAILITPICPHTLSFRPMLLPDSMELRICVPYNSRSTAWASFDGRGRVELKQGDHIKVTASKYPFPTVCADKQSTDWFHAISRTLKWNERERQKSFVVVEEEGPSKPKKRRSKDSNTDGTGIEQADEDAIDEEDEVSDEEEEEDEEEEKFDIDDSSTEAPATKDALHGLNLREETVGVQKTKDMGLDRELRRSSISAGKGRKSKSRSRSRSGLRSGVESPGRYAGPSPHLLPRSERRVGFAAESTPEISESEPLSANEASGRPIPPLLSARSQRDTNETVQTPTPHTLSHRQVTRTRHSHSRRSRSADHHHRRAFAVFGQDESDSNASDSSADS